jgi:TolA-binding protein
MKVLGVLWATALTVATTSVMAAPVGDLTTFVAGTPARAAEVNGNFSAVRAAVDDNDARIRALEQALSSMQEILANTRTALESC